MVPGLAAWSLVQKHGEALKPGTCAFGFDPDHPRRASPTLKNTRILDPRAQPNSSRQNPSRYITKRPMPPASQALVKAGAVLLEGESVACPWVPVVSGSDFTNGREIADAPSKNLKPGARRGTTCFFNCTLVYGS